MLVCPECGSQRTWKDGLRYVQGTSVQRFICRSCGYRFSETSLNVSKGPECNQKVHGLALNRSSSLLSNRQICATQTKGTKNLAEVETRTKNGLAGATEGAIKTTDFFEEFSGDIRFYVLKYADNRLKQGCTEEGVKSYLYCLRNLLRNGADMNNPESIKNVIAKMNVSPRTKNYHIGVYDSFIKSLGKTWQKPKYVCSQKLPFVPLESELNLLIGGCSKTISTVLQTIKERGARVSEVTRIKWDDIDFKRNVISINYPEKGSLPRQIKVSAKLIAMLNNIPRRRKTVFAKKSQIAHQFYKQRKRLAFKLKNSGLRQIGFHSIRHWHATMEFHKTKNLLHVQQRLGHKNIRNTTIYIHLIATEGDEYHSATAKTAKEVCKLVDAGFDYVYDVDDLKIFKKRK